MKRTAQLLALAIGLFAQMWLATSAGAVDTDNITRKRQAQVRARAMARELITGVLDIQLRQLEENQLKDLPIYGEIKSMRLKIDEVEETKMQRIVDALLAVQEEKDQQAKLEKFNVARDEIRIVVRDLIAERQKLLRRLQVARVAAQVRELIRREEAILASTQQIKTLPTTAAERATLTAQADQKDMRELFYELVDSLTDMKTWGGHLAAAASDAAIILNATGVNEEVSKAVDFLGNGQTEEAIASEKAIIKGLNDLLDRIEQTRGRIGADREEAIKMVQEIIEAQRTVREETEDSELTEDKIEELTADQLDIHKQIGQLAELLGDLQQVQPLLDQAKASALAARDELFEADADQADAEQGKVVGSLAEVEEQLKQLLEDDDSSKSADELAQDVQQLTEAKEALEQIAENQEQAEDNAADNPAATKQQEEAVQAALEQLGNEKELPAGVEAALRDAAAEAEEAAQAAADASAEAAEERQQAAEEAGEALDRAIAETEAALADKQRQQLAVEVGEEARAAEALERVAAAEQAVAEEASDAAQAEGIEAAQAEELVAEQEKAAEAVQEIAEGLKNTAPEVAEALQEALKPIEQAQEALEAAQAAEAEGNEEANKAAAEQAAEAAQEASEALAEAAAALREELAQDAEELVQVADEQLQQAEAAREAVEEALANVSDEAEIAKQL